MDILLIGFLGLLAPSESVRAAHRSQGAHLGEKIASIRDLGRPQSPVRRQTMGAAEALLFTPRARLR